MIVRLFHLSLFGSFAMSYSQLGTAGISISLFLYAFANAYLYMPARSGDTFTQELFQDIAWTRDELPGKIAARLVLIQSQQRLNIDEGAGRLDVAEQAAAWAGEMAVEGLFGDDKYFRKAASMFCMETASIMSHWAWLAYRDLVSVFPPMYFILVSGIRA